MAARPVREAAPTPARNTRSTKTQKMKSKPSSLTTSVVAPQAPYGELPLPGRFALAGWLALVFAFASGPFEVDPKLFFVKLFLCELAFAALVLTLGVVGLLVLALVLTLGVVGLLLLLGPLLLLLLLPLLLLMRSRRRSGTACRLSVGGLAI